MQELTRTRRVGREVVGESALGDPCFKLRGRKCNGYVDYLIESQNSSSS